MQTLIKLQDIATHMHLEPAEETPNLPPLTHDKKVAPCGQIITLSPKPIAQQSSIEKQRAELGISYAVMPNGKRMPLLKTLLTSACERNCNYCPFRAGRNYRRTTFKPEEMAKTFLQIYRAGLAEGLFLSSGIIGGGVRTQDKLLTTAEILRYKYAYKGYLHLKIMPGAEKAQVERAMQLASRLSVNLEAPNEKRLYDLAPMKQFTTELLRPLRWMQEIRQEQSQHLGWNGRWPSSTTQFVVGGTDESDLELLSTAAFLYQNYGLQRTYFSGFSPIPDTPLENRAAVDPWRQNRLYQASFLLRDYGWDLEEMPFLLDGNLPLDEDPKLAWARENLTDEPVEINRASRPELLRVPGIGPKSAATIVQARRRGTLRDVIDLRKLGVKTKRLEPYVLLDGKRPLYQLPLL